MPELCPVCRKPGAEVALRTDGSDVLDVECSACTTFSMSDDLGREFSWDAESTRHILSSIIRNRSERGLITELTTANHSTFLDSVRLPKTPLDYVILLLRHLEREQDEFHDWVFVEDISPASLFAKDHSAAKYTIDCAYDLGYLDEMDGKSALRLSLSGWDYLEEINRTGADSRQAFVAMSFDKSMDDTYEKGIRPALDATGFQPLRIDRREDNEKICDTIIAEIRRSGLLVAEATGQNPGVMFEAGFALGLDIPIIWVVKASETKKLHFDTRQYRHVTWNTPAELAENLVARIEATLPNRFS